MKCEYLKNFNEEKYFSRRLIECFIDPYNVDEVRDALEWITDTVRRLSVREKATVESETEIEVILSVIIIFK